MYNRYMVVTFLFNLMLISNPFEVGYVTKNVDIFIQYMLNWG